MHFGTLFGTIQPAVGCGRVRELALRTADPQLRCGLSDAVYCTRVRGTTVIWARLAAAPGVWAPLVESRPVFPVRP
jgi:hypothetical protein